MPDPKDQARGSGQDADLPAAPTNKNQLPSEPTRPDATPSLTADGPGFETWLEQRRQLTGLAADEARARLLDSVADFAEAKAEEASHQAAAEPSRQRMSLWERGVKLLLIAVLTLAVIGLAIATFLFSPWLLSLGLPPLAVAAWKRFGKKGDSRYDEDEGDP